MITLAKDALSVSFRSPDIANKYSIDANIITKYTRGQKVITYRDTNWKNIETEVFAFKHIRENKRQEIDDFISATLGQEIEIELPRYTDCGSDIYTLTGYIYSDIINYTCIGRDGCSNIYEFGLVILYKITALDLKYLLTEAGTQLVTEAGQRLKIEAD